MPCGNRLLKVPRVGLADDFFELGGDSIVSIGLAHRMSELLGAHVSVADVFIHRTLEALLEGVAGAPVVHIDKSEGSQAPLSYGQQRMWFIEQFEQGSSAYLIPMFFELAPGAHKDAVQRALRAIVERHSILRTVIEQDEQGAAVQRVPSSWASNAYGPSS